MPDKPKILFLCTGNSCRSQMAEGFCNHFHKETLTAYSAGVEKHRLNPFAVKVMSEVGIDISKHKSKLVFELPEKNFDFVITLCSDAQEKCPYFPAKVKVLHVGFDDPPLLVKGLTNEEEILFHYRRVRDEIRDFILSIKQSIG